MLVCYSFMLMGCLKADELIGPMHVSCIHHTFFLYLLSNSTHLYICSFCYSVLRGSNALNYMLSPQCRRKKRGKNVISQSIFVVLCSCFPRGMKYPNG